jgi:uncharacterized protein (DUF2164 family)
MRNSPTLTIPDDARKQALASLQQYFAEHMDEEIGDLKAGLMLDFILAELAPTIYNQAIADASTFFEERAADLAGACYYTEFPYWAKRKR